MHALDETFKSKISIAPLKYRNIRQGCETSSSTRTLGNLYGASASKKKRFMTPVPGTAGDSTAVSGATTPYPSAKNHTVGESTTAQLTAAATTTAAASAG